MKFNRLLASLTVTACSAIPAISFAGTSTVTVVCNNQCGETPLDYMSLRCRGFYHENTSLETKFVELQVKSPSYFNERGMYKNIQAVFQNVPYATTGTNVQCTEAVGIWDTNDPQCAMQYGHEVSEHASGALTNFPITQPTQTVTVNMQCMH